MLKLKLPYFGHLMRRTDSLEKTLRLAKIGGGRRRGWQRMRWFDEHLTQWTWVRINSGSWWWTGRPGMLQSVGLQRVGHDWATELNCELLWASGFWVPALFCITKSKYSCSYPASILDLGEECRISVWFPMSLSQEDWFTSGLGKDHWKVHKDTEMDYNTAKIQPF